MAKKTKSTNNSTDMISSNQGVTAPKARQQINIRLSHDDGQRLTELKEYWASKGSISFLHKSESGDSVFDSNSTLARFIMETGLQYLHLDLINEKQIETIAKLICKERKENEKIKKQWQLISPNWESFKENDKPEWKTYINLVDKIVKPLVAEQKLVDEDESGNSVWNDDDVTLFESMWPIALTRSHSMKDDELSNQTLLTRTQILQKRYGIGPAQ